MLSHPFLDWLNNYGVRLLMPFSDRWFYGDTLFIVDPWLWLILGGGVMLAWTSHTRGLMTAAVAVGGHDGRDADGADRARVGARGLDGGPRDLGAGAGPRGRTAPAARSRPGALALAGLYIAMMYAGSRIAEQQVRELARARGWAVEQVAAMPVPAEPLRRSVIVVSDEPVPVRARHLDRRTRAGHRADGLRARAPWTRP